MSPLTSVLVLWGVVTALLAAVLIYRSIVAMKEDDQLFLDSSQRSMQEEQDQIQARLKRLSPYTKALTACSGILLIASAGMYLAQILKQYR